LAGSSDLVLMIGYDPIEMRLGWLDFGPDANHLVDISQIPPDHAMHHPGARIVAEPKALLQALNGSVDERKSWVDGEPAKAKGELDVIFATKAAWGPHNIIDQLNQIAGANGLLTVDSGAHRILLSQKWVAAKPLSLLQSAGFCTMNAALPLAIGVLVADPSRNVFAVMGDGGLEMGIGELATVRDLHLPLTIVLFQDRSLALIAMKQAAAGLASAGVKLGETDFAAVAKGFGGYGVNVENSNDFRNELEAAGERAGFSLIACRFDASAYDGAF
jgi:acetolactate synthase-1/2/3 large subunit